MKTNYGSICETIPKSGETKLFFFKTKLDTGNKKISATERNVILCCGTQNKKFGIKTLLNEFL